MRNDITKQDLYESVKTLVECESDHIHLTQHKLFTLFSLAFQYMLFKSTKNPGAYIIRAQDSQLAEKLSKKSKDSSTRRFLQSLMVPRKFKYGKSIFFLDFFHVGSWNLTKDIEPNKVKGAIIIKNNSSRPMDEVGVDEVEGEYEVSPELKDLPKDYYLSSLLEIADETITISYEALLENLTEVTFPFIKKSEEKTISGVTLGKDINWDSI